MASLFLGLLVFVLGYSVAKFLLNLVPPLSPLVEILSISIGVLAAYAGMALLPL